MLTYLQIAHKAFKAPKRQPAFQAFEDVELEAARALVAEEAAAVQLEIAANAGGSLPEVAEVADLQVRRAERFLVPFVHEEGLPRCLQDELRASHIYDASTGHLVPRGEATSALRRSAAEDQLNGLISHYAREKARLDKQTQRLGLLTRGYEDRSAALNRGIGAAASERVDEQIKLSCFAALASGEEFALSSRLSGAQSAMSEAAAQERQLQSRYAALLREIDSLRLRLLTAGISV